MRQFSVKRLGEILVDDDSRKQFLAKVRLQCRRILIFLTLSYVISLLLCIVFFRYVGEKNLTFAFGLYVPRAVFLLPAIILFPVLLLIHRRLFALLAVACALFVWIGMGWEIRKTPTAVTSQAGKEITVLTYNRGQNANQSLQPFKNATTPDVVALQEASGRAGRYAEAAGYEEFKFTKSEGEFTLLSRYPISSSALVIVPQGNRGLATAARFEIDFSGTPIAIYNVHVISPRDTLKYYFRGSFLYGIIGIPGTSLGEKRKINQVFWDERVEQARELVQIMRDDPLPVLIVGDFNAPAGGYIHSLFQGEFSDAHAESGHGFGYSFPGVTRNPLSLGGPWMRIDYLYCNENWTPVWCITESDRPSQHRAVTAQFRIENE